MRSTRWLRLLIASMWVTGLASAALEVVLLQTLPDPLARFAIQAAAEEPSLTMWFGLIGGSLSLLVTIVGSIQLWRLKRSGKAIFLAGIVGTIIATPLLGPVIFTPAGILLYDVSSLLGGVVLGFVYIAGLPATD